MAAAAGFTLLTSALTTMPAAQAAEPVEINLLNINDFHGRIDDNTVAFAATLEQLRAASGEDNTLFLSAGDNIGASVFASAVQNDVPTLDVLNALDLQASSVGNHEFDKGYTTLTTDVADAADFPYLGANVYDTTTGDPALDEYALLDVQGITVGVVGAVTQETPTLVSPGGISNLEFGDPVAAVNRVADQLSDGNDANGEADIIVAEYHEGATAGADSSTLEDQVALGGAFADIVQNTDADVDAIFTGHTHMAYAWDAPIPGGTGTRPIVQTGSYGANIGQIRLSVDPDTFTVTGYEAQNVPQIAPEDTDGDGEISDAEQAAFDERIAGLVAQYPRVEQVQQIVAAALAYAEEQGKDPVGEITADITTAFTGGTYEPDGTYSGGERDDRSSESTMGHLVANMLRDTLAPAELGGAEIGVTNPGGLRAELFFKGTGDPETDTDGVVTYAEANAVLPFVNNLWTLTLTGAQFKQVLEEQWQPAGASRPFLHLGLSDNVAVTTDPTAPEGSRITSVRVNGEPLDPAREYRIGTFSFLAQGGDNFTTFTEGTNVEDSGLIDRDGWIAYLGSHSPSSPDFARRQVSASNLPTGIEAGGEYAFQLTDLDLTSLGSTRNTAVTASLVPAPGGTGGTTELGTFPVTDGVADISFTAPATIPEGYVVQLVAAPSGTTVTIPAAAGSGTTALPSTTRAWIHPHRVVVDRTNARLLARVRTDDGPATGVVEVHTGDRLLGRDSLRHGRAWLRLREFHQTGAQEVTVSYLGNDTTAPSETTLRVWVRPRHGHHRHGHGHGGGHHHGGRS